MKPLKAGFAKICVLNWPVLLRILVLLVVYGSLVFAQVYRYRRVSTLIERQQTKWIVFGVSVALLGFLLLAYLLPAFLELFIPLQSWSLLPYVIVVTSIYLVLLPIPLSFAVARSPRLAAIRPLRLPDHSGGGALNGWALSDWPERGRLNGSPASPRFLKLRLRPGNKKAAR